MTAIEFMERGRQILLRETKKQAPAGEETFLTKLYRAVMRSPICRRVLTGLGCFAGSFLLSAVSLAGRPLPLAATLILTVVPWPEKLLTLAGAGVGYALLFGWELAMEPISLLLSCLAAAVIFRRTPISMPLVTGSLTAAVGVVFLLDTGVRPLTVAVLTASVAMAAAAPVFWARALDGKHPVARWTAWGLFAAGLWRILFRASPVFLLALGCGALTGRLFPAQFDVQKTREAFAPQPIPEQRGVEKALRTMHGVLAREEPRLRPIQLNEVYDFAAEQVCRCCVGCKQCWETLSEDTYSDLCAAGEAAMLRGVAVREDFPERFLSRCRHTEGFLTAVNQALDAAAARRREARRFEDGRQIAAGQYLLLERLLHTLSRSAPSVPPAFLPEMAVGTAARVGNRVSGDRGSACRDRFGHFYILLCDGMGTGPAARAESDRAAKLLTSFLEAGAEADGAMALLNGFYALRGEAAFSTMDLLKLDLRTGEGVLYKWGAAPSYLRTGEGVKKIGTGTPPPGLDAAGSRAPGQYALSLKEGETLVMVSDGAFGAETEQRLQEVAAGTVRDLAACLITLGETSPADDRTAVVLRLKPAKAS